MTVESLHAELYEACALGGDRALIRFSARCQPEGTPGAKVMPPTYPQDGNSSPYIVEGRLVDGEEGQVVLLDSVPSQANRCELALLAARDAGQVAIPLIELRVAVDGRELRLTSLEFPHRYADAYLQNSVLNGVAFDKTSLGESLQAATPADASALYASDPGSLVFGAWNSHRKGMQAKFPRVYRSEVIGRDPVEGKRRGGRMDPLNLIGAAKPADGVADWTYARPGEKVKGEKLSERGLGNIAPGPVHGGVTISEALRQGSLSFAALARLRFGAVPDETAVAARAALAAYALLADRLAFGGSALWLRSGCDLVVIEDAVEWVSRGGVAEPLRIDAEAARALFVHARDAAAQAGLAMELETVAVDPNASLLEAIEFSVTKAESTEQ